MASQKAPKAVMFDIGGVVVLSPMQGILDYERRNHIPDNWINFAIRYSSPNGHWQRLERGEIKMDGDFFKGFTADLHNKDAWKEYNNSFRNQKAKLKDVANPTQLGDHVSLKGEAVDSRPTDQDRGAQRSGPSSSGRPSLSKLAKDTTIGDPVSLESEQVVEASQSDDTPSTKPPLSNSKARKTSDDISDLPSINGEELFWMMMAASRHPDPYVFPALERLKAQNPRPIVAALSNTVTYPADHPWAKQERQVPSGTSSPNAFFFNPSTFFDVYTGSAEVGMRKPSREIYELALKRINEFAQKNGKGDIKAEDVVFLDDIGENLKMGREVGMRTIRVQLGKTWRAVKELETTTGLELMDEKTRRSKL